MTGANGSVVPVVLPISPALCRPFRVMCMPSEGILFSSICNMGNEGQITLEGQPVRIKQETRYPWEGRIKLTLDHSPASSFTLALRIPGWVQQQPLPGTLYTYLDKDTTSYTISLNGKTVKPEVRNGYALLRWRLEG